MNFELFDLLIVVLIFQLVVFCLFLFLGRAGRLSNYLLGIQLFSQAAGIFVTFTNRQFPFFLHNAPYMFFAGYPFFFFWGPTFYLYVKSVAFTDYKLTKKTLVHFLPAAAVTLYLVITFFSTGFERQQYLVYSRNYVFFRYGYLFDYFIRAQVLFYIILSVKLNFVVRKKFNENYSSSSNIILQWIRFLVTGFTLCYFATIPVILYLRLLNVYNSMLVIFVMLPYFIFFNIIFIKGWYHPELFSGIVETVKYKTSKLTAQEAEEWIGKLNRYIAECKPYINPELSLNQLAENIGISPRMLSQVINEYFNQNFHDYINKLRIEESKKLLLESRGKTILEILYEVGFNTKSAYNVAFKKTTGYTPSGFKKKYGKKNVQEV